MPKIDRRSLVLLLLGIQSDGEIGDGMGGITRLQKLLYLLEQEGHVTPTDDGFEFAAYKAGPYSSKLYDDLEFLENLGLIDSEVAAEATEEEAVEVDMLDFDELMSEHPDVKSPHADDGYMAADSYEERRFKVTPEGIAKIEDLLSSTDYEPVIDGIRKIKSKYGAHSLRDLLHYVYKKYPEMTTESEIKEKVLRRGR
jgi:hypothetical protein